ncbi:hypothetical protein P7D22_13165 [Lichenihabitans sp. Uapishka_5]|uniref:hypothetical protein n=1 Tax=Lichenihabitans sp. Uapishka_5 TaxID=3037302 RepID=UPI0029E7F43C|nr:hypothetical protein [Lichenihabitans sp. Uapishka_5]MDX7952124.1 hypothetical protein [Lichenihabitans sp. Uapishka_5]
MMRPIGLYLAEFRPDGALPALPSFGTLPALPTFGAQPALLDLSLGDEDEVLALPPPFADPPNLMLEAPHGELFEPETVEPLALPRPDIEAALAAQDATHVEAMAAARALWAAEEGATLAARLDAAFEALQGRLAEALAPLLEPFLAKAAQQKALGQLGDALASLLGGGETRAVTVSGPADLVAALAERYGDRPAVTFTPSEAPDVTVALGDTRIRSQLRAWTRKLDAALGAQA